MTSRRGRNHGWLPRLRRVRTVWERWKFKAVQILDLTQTPYRIQFLDTLSVCRMWKCCLLSRSATILCESGKSHNLSKNKQSL